MLMSYNQMLTLIRQGYLGLQIPEIYLETEADKRARGSLPNDKCIEMPDNWFIRAHFDRGPCIGAECGCLYLSSIGYKANKERIKEAFELALNEGNDRTHGRGWIAFEEEAKRELYRFTQKLNKRITKARQEQRELWAIKEKYHL